MNNLNKDFEKLKKIILSCKTKEQLKCSNNMFLLFMKKWDHLIDSQIYAYLCGQIHGIFESSLKNISTDD